MTEQKLSFQAEVSRLLHLMVNSVYSDREVFLRELISNASDACDKLRYRAIAEPALLAEDAELRLEISVDVGARTLSVADNGVGMDRDDLIQDLGTIARSGTSAFVDSLTGDAAKDMTLIGQFGVGFYSAFMVAERVEVISRKSGDAQAWRWSSDGLGEFEVAEATRDGRGTTVTLHLKTGEDDWLDSGHLRRVIKKYSDHIALPIRLQDGDGEPETINAASAIWTRPKSEITDEAEAPVREAEIATLIALLKQSLGEAVKDVRTTDRLTDSAVCLVADEGDMDLRLERLLKAHQQLQQSSARILEINPSHALIRQLALRAGESGAADALDDMAHLLLDQALIVEGEALPDPAAFARRMAMALAKAV